MDDEGKSQMQRLENKLSQVIETKLPELERRLETRVDTLEDTVNKAIRDLNGYIHGRMHDIANAIQTSVSQTALVITDMKDVVLRLVRLETTLAERDRTHSQSFGWKSALGVGLVLAVGSAMFVAVAEKLIGVGK